MPKKSKKFQREITSLANYNGATPVPQAETPKSTCDHVYQRKVNGVSRPTEGGPCR